MIEYKSSSSTEQCFERKHIISIQDDGKLSLTKLWECIVRTKRLPDGSDVNLLYNCVRDKLRDPEREVRQHALRVLLDLIPVTQSLSLDDHMRELVPELVLNLSHSAPALRKSALDSLRKYLEYSGNCDKLLMELISTTENNVIAAAPFLISSHTDDKTLGYIIDHLWIDLSNPRLNQEVTAKSLAGIRHSLGNEKFKLFVGTGRYNEIQRIFDSFGLPGIYVENEFEKISINSEEEIEDKVILETEITLKTGPAITMKIHEEGKENPMLNFGVLEILEDDSESDFYEKARRTPRKVRFGGESVKLRTPESDSSHHDEHKGTIRITVTDAISIKTKRSLIPIRISSLPSTPRKNLPLLTNYTLHKSTPNLGRSHPNSRIPLKRNSNVAAQLKEASVTKKEESKCDQNFTRQYLCKRTDFQNSASGNRTGGSISPIPPHKEIEVFHNLTRSPERVTNPVDRTSGIESTVEKEVLDHYKGNDYDSFELFSETNEVYSNEKSSQGEGDQIDEKISDTMINENTSGSFQVCPESLEPNMKSLHFTPSTIEEVDYTKELISDDSRDEAKTNSVYDAEENNIKSEDLSYDPLQLWQKDADNVAINNSKDAYDSFQVVPRRKNSPQDNEEADIILYENRNTSNSTAILAKDHRRILHHNWPIASLISEDHSWNKTQALDSLVKMLKQPNTCDTLEPGPATLLFEALFSCQQVDNIPFLAEDAFALLIKGLRIDVLQKCLGRLAISLCKIGSPSGVSLALMIMKRCEAKLLQIEIINTCFSHKLREGALQILMAAARILPSSDIEIKKITEFAASALRDRRRRVRHGALETLATLASLSSNAEVSDIVDRVNRAAPDHEYLVRVVRTRLSRRQLPAVEMDGTVLYSTPRESEVEWLSQIHLKHSQSSSASSSTHSVNYWKHNSRHGGGGVANSNASLQYDDGASGNQQIWAVDPSVFPRSNHNRNNKKGDPPVLKPVYFLQPETVIEGGGRGHRRHDRGRSSSPHKSYHKEVRDKVGSFSEQRVDRNTREVTSQFKCNEGFRKSLSSEHLHYSRKPQQEPHSFSLSSGSSTTSTGSSIKSSGWQRDMRSGIPVPITSETKLRLRTNTSSLNNNTNFGPVIARRSAIGTIPVTPITPRLSPRDIDGYSNDTRILTPPPRSSGSESSGYFTPPSETRAFVKLDSEARSSESEEKEEIIENDKNNNSHNCLESFDENTQQVVLQDDSAKENVADISGEQSYREEEVITANEIKELPPSDVVSEEKITLIRRFSISSSKDISFTGSVSPLTDKKKKSKSSVDLQNFLPEIPNRKSACSAPPLKDELLAYTSNDLIITSYEDVTSFRENHSSEESVLHCDEVDQTVKSPKGLTVTRTLSRRLSRTPSKRSIKSTPRSVRDLTPKTSGIKPKESMQTALAQMNNQEWEVMIQGLQNLTKVARSHPEIIEANIHNVCISLARHIKNLRSQVARSACHTSSEIFGLCRKGLDMELEEIAGPLLHRTADTNKFLRADANTALDVMCEQLPANRVIMVITSRGCNHQNNIVRSAAMRLLTNIVKKLGSDRIFQMSKDLRDRVILAGANSLGDGSLEARNHGKILLSYLISHPQFQKVLLDTVPQNTLRHIAKTLNSIKPHTGT